ncbi:restriction endonuclease subunit S [Vibrio fluvialis]|nr:restriction endonuclease subunit S [Vibrio fluvialis]
MSWPLVKLGEVAPSKALKRPIVRDEDNVWQLNLDMVESGSGKVLNKIKAPLSEAGSSTHWFDSRHVLYSKLRPYLNKVVLPDEQGLATTELVPMLPDPEMLDRRYLVHYLRSKQFVSWISDQVAGAKMPRVSMKVFWEHEIPLPPLDEQKRIAAILDKADAIRQKRKQAIELADEFLRSVFLDMFGDPVTNPKGWETSTLDKLVNGKFQNGAYFPKEQYSVKGVEMVHMSDAFYDYVPRGSMKRVMADYADLKKYNVNHKDLLISRRSLNYEGAAKPSLIEESEEPLLFESSLIRITPNSKLMNKLYLFAYLSNELVKEHKIRKYVTGATIKGISQKNLEKVEVLVPPVELQRKFADIFMKIEKLKTQLHQPLLSIEIFESLSQKAFSGQL